MAITLQVLDDRSVAHLLLALGLSVAATAAAPTTRFPPTGRPKATIRVCAPDASSRAGRPDRAKRGQPCGSCGFASTSRRPWSLSSVRASVLWPRAM